MVAQNIYSVSKFYGNVLTPINYNHGQSPDKNNYNITAYNNKSILIHSNITASSRKKDE